MARAVPALASVLPDNARVLIAVSGGPDSLALLMAAAAWSRERPAARVFAATVDHGLRPGSAREAVFCARIASKLHVPHVTLAWEGMKPRAGVQAAARKARYRLLAEEARLRDAHFIATAHHADDQAETVLMRLAAGSGVSGLRGMRKMSALDDLTLVRPFLGMPKAILEAVCREAGVTPVDDPSNADPRFGRARIRTLLPQLADEGLTVERLNRLARRAASADDALDCMAKARLSALTEARTDCVTRIDGLGLAAEPAEIRLRVLARALAEAAPRSGLVKLESLEALETELHDAIVSGRRLRRTLAGGMVTLKSDGKLILGPAPPRRDG